MPNIGDNITPARCATEKVANAPIQPQVLEASEPITPRFGVRLEKNKHGNWVLHASGVGLSYSSESQRFLLQTTVYRNGEATVKLTDTTRLNTSAKPPVREGQLVTNGLTRHASKMIKRSSRIYQDLVERSDWYGKAYCSFITLTYGRDYPTDTQAKKHLKGAFFSAFRRYCQKHNHEVMYTWVAERQKRGAIHFHILTPNYIEKKWINKTWNRIVNNWLESEGKQSQKLLPNVIAVHNAGTYMAKYMSKEGAKIDGNMWNMCSNTRELMKPTHEITFVVENHPNDVAEFMCNKINSDGIHDRMYLNTDYFGNTQAWISSINEFQLQEFINYDAPEIGIIQMADTLD